MLRCAFVGVTNKRGTVAPDLQIVHKALILSVTSAPERTRLQR